MSKHSLTWVAIFLLITTMFLKLPPMVAKQDAVLHTYAALVEVDALARQQFVEPIHGDRLVHGAIRGMILQLDAYSGYISPNELPAFERRNLGQYIGIGVEIGIRDERLTIVAPIEGSPAAEAGILAGDTIVSIDGVDVEGVSVFDVEETLAGPAGTGVMLTVINDGETEPRTVTVLRGPVSLVTVRGYSRDAKGRWSFIVDEQDRIGYVRVSNFLGNTVKDFDAALEELRRRKVRGIILDLRFNPGGIMHQAVAIVDRFVDDGIIVSTVNRRRAVQEYRATRQTPAKDLPLAVLVNHASASASEIVAGSLQDHGRAVIMGERTFGKGCIQHMIYLTEHKAAISLTTAYYRLPNGRIIHRTEENTDAGQWGVSPDIQIYIDDDELHAVRERRRALDHGTFPADRSSDDTSTDAPLAPPPTEIYRDRQLREAISQIRTMIKEGVEHPR